MLTPAVGALVGLYDRLRRIGIRHERIGAALRSSRARSLASAVLCASLYALWAALANASHGAARAVRAGVTQAAITFTLTLVVTLLIEALYRLPKHPAASVAASTLGAVIAAATLSLSAHTLMGTPRILRTTAPLLAIGGVCSLCYALNLDRLRKNGSSPPKRGDKAMEE
jgi:hypothetical protein